MQAVREARGLERDHRHVDARIDRERDRLLVRVGDLVDRDQLPDVLPVGHDDALEAELVAQQLGQQVVGRMHRLAVDRARVGHDRLAARVDPADEGRQVLVPQLALGERGVLTVTAAVRRRVTGEVLRRRGDPLGQVVALEAAHRCGHEVARGERRLAERLVGAAPAQVAPDIGHRGEIPVNAGRAHVRCGRLSELAGQPGVVRRTEPELVREHRRAQHVVVPVHRVDPVDDRNAVRLAAQGELLDVVRHLCPGTRRVLLRRGPSARQDRPREVLAQHVVQDHFVQRTTVPRVTLNALERRRVDLRHLADLLLERHARQEIVGPLLG